MPLLWAIRDELGRTGTKYGCGIGQCGYCQSGQIVQAAAPLAQDPDPSDEKIDRYMSGNLCRCGAYPRIRAAVRAAAAKLQEN